MKLEYREESRFFHYLNYLGDLVVYSLLWLLCSLPVITIGASTAAIISVQLDLVRGPGASGVRHFFEQFRRTFFRATKAWIAVLAVGFLMLVDYEFIMGQPAGVRGVLLPVCIGVSIFLLFICVYLFPVLSGKEMPLKRAVSVAARMSVAYLPRTLLLAVIAAVPVLEFLFVPSGVVVYTFPIWLFIGFSLLANLSARLLSEPLLHI